MPDQNNRPADQQATEAPVNALLSDSSSTSATSLDLPIVDDGTISLRIKIDFQSSPRRGPSGGGLVGGQRLTEGGSEDTKEAGRSHPPRRLATGS